LIKAAKRHPGVFVLMNSVGTGVTIDKARRIIEAGLGAWNFSVDTLDPALYERLRGIRGALATIMTAIGTVREAGRDFPEFRINYLTVITRHNFRGLPVLLAHCVDTGIASVYLMNVYGDTTGQSLLTGPEIGEFRDIVVPEMLAVLKAKGTAPVVQVNAAEVLASFFSAENPDANYARGIYWPDMDSVRQACRVPSYYSLIEPDGRVLPCCRVPADAEVILADRSVHTMLAYSYALEVMTGTGLFGPWVRLLRRSPIPAWPGLVFCLDLPQQAVSGRNGGKFPAGSIYIDPVFNAAIRGYFLRLAGRNTLAVAWLDAMLDPGELAWLAEARARRMRALREIQAAG
jgi:hypothetical protein